MSLPHNMSRRVVGFCRVGSNPHTFISGAPRMGIGACTEIGAGIFDVFLGENIIAFSDNGPIWEVRCMLGAPGLYGVLRQSASHFRVTVVDAAGAPLRTTVALVVEEFFGPRVS